MLIRIKWQNGKISRWLGIGEAYTIENLKRLIDFLSDLYNCNNTNYQLEYKN